MVIINFSPPRQCTTLCECRVELCLNRGSEAVNLDDVDQDVGYEEDEEEETEGDGDEEEEVVHDEVAHDDNEVDDDDYDDDSDLEYF